MSIELSVLIGLASVSIAAITFFIGRQSAAKKDGQEWGELKTDIKYIKTEVKDIKASMGESAKSMMAAIDKERAERLDSIRRIHEKIEEHIKTFHKPD